MEQVTLHERIWVGRAGAACFGLAWQTLNALGSEAAKPKLDALAGVESTDVAELNAGQAAVRTAALRVEFALVTARHAWAPPEACDIFPQLVADAGLNAVEAVGGHAGSRRIADVTLRWTRSVRDQPVTVVGAQLRARVWLHGRVRVPARVVVARSIADKRVGAAVGFDGVRFFSVGGGVLVLRLFVSRSVRDACCQQQHSRQRGGKAATSSSWLTGRGDLHDARG